MRYRTKSLRRRRESNKWEVVLVHDDPLTGEEVQSYHTVDGKTRKQAEVARNDLIVNLELNGLAVSSNITIKQFMEAFLQYKIDSKTIEPSTIRGYRHEIKQMCKYIGAERLGDLNIPTVNAFLAKMSADGYAPKSVAKCFRLLKQGLNYAIAQDLITKNPCNFCKPPKRAKTPINALSREERSRMLDIARRAQPSPLAAAIELALTTGMRRGEICALRWSDFDEDKHQITVTHALGNGEGGFYLKEPKTAGSARTIPLTKHTYHMLLDMKSNVKWMRGKLKLPFVDTFILGTLEDESRPYNPTQLGKDFSAFCKMNKFDCTFHDLRHTFATFMISQGVDVRTVSSYLGHSSVSMTLNVYADVDPEAKESAVSKIEEAFDDPMSVFTRESESRRLELNEQARALGIDPDNEPPTMSPNNIPFTVAELESMLATLQAAN